MRKSKPGRTGFTLIELLAVIGILGLLLTLSVPIISKARASANLAACKLNLRNIAGLLQNWVDTRNGGKWPTERGIRFLLVVARDGELGRHDAEIFVCPGTSDTTWAADDAAHRPGSGFSDWQDLDKNCISYAGRDAKSFPIDKNKLSDEIIASDDNDGRANHKFITNVVFADAHVEQVDLKDYKGVLADDAEWVPVGPGSPDPDLKKLLND
jgi:prepilin-type N-terminal cleavage/methylation domain-containing protein/prepilin-type processing-associated H-X9-DG protein